VKWRTFFISGPRPKGSALGAARDVRADYRGVQWAQPPAFFQFLSFFFAWPSEIQASLVGTSTLMENFFYIRPPPEGQCPRRRTGRARRLSRGAGGSAPCGFSVFERSGSRRISKTIDQHPCQPAVGGRKRIERQLGRQDPPALDRGPARDRLLEG
jgi:hypothetical protein